ATWSFTRVLCTPDGASHPCPGYTEGRCKAGTRTCTAPGVWSACDGAVAPSMETCNDEDDDCDGIVDEGTNNCNGVCVLAHGPYTPCDGPDTDMCTEGVWRCTGRNSVSCVE